MNKNKKTLIKISVGFAILPFLILPSLFFINNKQTNLNLIRPQGFDVFDNLNNDKEVITKKLLNALVEAVFGDDKVKQQDFVKNQDENKEQLFKQVKELTNKYKKSKEQNDLKNLKEFYSTNWLFFLKNLDKFELQFIEYWKLESKNGKEMHSDSFLNALKNKQKPFANYSFLNNNLEQIHRGSETEDLTDLSVFYLKKEKFIIRTIIDNKNRKLNIDKFILFYESPINRITIPTISNAIHIGVFHNQKDGYESFEKNIVGAYGYAWDGILLLKE
ncbi:aromatic motif membrane protein [Mycoplasma feriruminatoris]|uniref:Uncharacterized protein n=1 Tax=Mycoplasma feriruminatoris TaxID=1179777 RepID=A0AAX3TG11_9MOLU|nr:aromatic motif membrane protein [Mycoplasma feriruminatoris]WFQ93076.1 hypothetical protein MFERI14822_00869 [Mycoplasma feriruminatoris]